MISVVCFSGNKNLQPLHSVTGVKQALGSATKTSFKSPGAGFLAATHLDEWDHVAQGFVHFLQSVFALLGLRAVVVPFHINALVVHCSHLGTVVAGRGEKGWHTWRPPGCCQCCLHQHVEPQNPVFCFQPVLSYYLLHCWALHPHSESPEFAWDSHRRQQVETAVCKHRLAWQSSSNLFELGGQLSL